MLLVKNCRFIPELTEGFDGEYGDILIGDDNKIISIADPGAHEWNGMVIDAEGKTVLPGFFDLHVHLAFTSFDFNSMCSKSIGDTCFDMYDFAREYLKQGYVVVRDAGSPYNINVALNKAKEKKLINIPHIISTGLTLTPTTRGNDVLAVLYDEVNTVDEVRTACRNRFNEGHDAIKYMVTGAYLNESGDPGATIAAEDELREAVKIAKLNGSYCMGHAHSADGIKKAIRAGFYTIEHGSFIDYEAIEMLKDNDECYLSPTGGVGIACLDEDNDGISQDALEKSRKYEMLERNSLNKAYEAGLKLGFGSDLDLEHFRKNPGLEFKARTDWYDFDYIDILKQATINSAQIMGMDESKGTIKAGKDADLVIIDGNPDQDIHVMEKLPAYVIYNGEVIEN